MVKARIPEQQRHRHTYIVGGTGSGKSEMLKVLIWETITKNKAAVVVLDPKGDLAFEVAQFVDHTLPHRQDKLVYLSPFDFPGSTFVINPFQLSPVSAEEYEEMVDITTKELTRTLQSIFEEMDSGFTGLMQSVLAPCIETLLRRAGSDFWDLMRFMDDSRNKDLVELGKASPNEGVRRFFQYDFPTISQATRDGIKWRTRTLLHSQIFARLTTGKSTINLKQLIEEKKCIILNLNKGKMSTDVSSYFGKLIVSLIQVIAQQRAGLPGHQKAPTHLFIDEFHNYVTRSIKDVLAEARSNKLYLTLAQQLVGQDIVDRNFKRVLMGNTNVKILAKSTHENYKELTDDFGIPTERMQLLPNFYYYVKVGHGAAFRVKGRTGLIANKNAMSAKQWGGVIQEQLQRYYVPVDLAIEEKKQQELERQKQTAQEQEKATASKADGKRKGKDKDTPQEPTPDNPLYPF